LTDKKFTLKSFVRSQWLPLGVLFLYLWAFTVDAERSLLALRVGFGTLASVTLLIIAVMGLVGLIQVWISGDIVARLLGKEGGWRALFLSVLCGTILIGPPYLIFPLLMAVRRQGARWAAITTVLATYAVKVQMIPLEIGFLGWKFSLLRSLFTVAVSVPLGLLVEWGMERGEER